MGTCHRMCFSSKWMYTIPRFKCWLIEGLLIHVWRQRCFSKREGSYTAPRNASKLVVLSFFHIVGQLCLPHIFLRVFGTFRSSRSRQPSIRHLVRIIVMPAVMKNAGP